MVEYVLVFYNCCSYIFNSFWGFSSQNKERKCLIPEVAAYYSGIFRMHPVYQTKK